MEKKNGDGVELTAAASHPLAAIDKGNEGKKKDCHDPKKGEHSAQGSSEDKIHHKSDLEKDGHEKKDKGVHDPGVENKQEEQVNEEKKDDSDHEDGSEVHVSDPEDEDKTNESPKLPVYLLCHSKRKLLEDPVVCKDGYSYEAKVVSWPKTRFKNHLLKEIIQSWRPDGKVIQLEHLLRCPLSRNLFSDPVIDLDGRTYEKAHLIKKRKEMRVSQKEFFPNKAILEIVEEYRHQMEKLHCNMIVPPYGSEETDIAVNFHVLVPTEAGVQVGIVECGYIEDVWSFREERNKFASSSRLQHMRLTLKMPPLSQFHYEYIGLDAQGYLKMRDSFSKDHRRLYGGDAQRVLKVSAPNTATDVYDTTIFQEHSNDIKMKCFSVYMAWMFEKMLKDNMKCIDICKEAMKMYNQIRKIRVHYESTFLFSECQSEDTLDASVLVYAKEWSNSCLEIICDCPLEQKKKAAYAALCIMSELINTLEFKKNRVIKNDDFFEFFRNLFEVMMIRKGEESAISSLLSDSYIERYKVKGKKAFESLFCHFGKHYGHKVKPIEYLNIVAYFQFLDEKSPIKAYSTFDNEELRKTTDTVPRDQFSVTCTPDDIKAVLESGLLEANPYLVSEIFSITPFLNYATVIHELPPLLTLAWIYQDICSKKPYHNKQRLNTIQAWIKTINGAIRKVSFSEEELECMKTCAKGIFTEVFGIINLKEKDKFDLRAIFVLCFNVLSKSLNVMMSQEEKLKEEYFEFMYKILKKKIEDCHESSFRSDVEFHVWENIWISETELEELFIEKCLRPLLMERVSKVSTRTKFRLLCVYGSSCNELKILIANEVSDCVLEMMSKDDGKSILTELEKYKVPERYFWVAIHTLCVKHVEDIMDDITLHDLLEWQLWPKCLKYCKNKEDTYYKRIVKVLEQDCSLFQDGNIPIKTLEELMSKEETFKSLLMEASLNKYWSAYLEQRRAYDAYVDHRDLLSTVTASLKKFMSDELKEVLTMDLSEKVVRDVSVICEGGYKFPLLQDFEILSAVLTQMKSLFLDHQNDIFNGIWNREISRTPTELTMNEIITNIWTPAYQSCVEICEQIKDLSMGLDKVRDFFIRYSGPKLKYHITELLKGIHAKNTLSPEEEKCVTIVECRVGYYKEILKYEQVAEAILEIQKEYGLTGDFEAITKIKNVSTMQQPRLKDIDNSMVIAGKNLESAAPEDIHLKILESIAVNSDILKWIKGTAKDSNDLKAFVNLALDTGAGGEDSYSRDMMKHLRDLGTSFASFIWIEKDSNHRHLLLKCEEIWATVNTKQALHSLLAILISCNKDLDRYKQIKEIHGNVEATSFGQLKSILTCGRCIVGKGDDVIYQNTSSLIEVILKEEEKVRLPKNHYSYTELEDLESRLVLIAGKDEKDKNKEHVDTYLRLLDILRRISRNLIILQQAGCETYIGWKLTFEITSMVAGYEHLANIATNMEVELRIWNETIKVARSQYYFLNYFTTNQLLYLRKNLKYFEENDQCVDDTTEVRTLNLLNSVSPELTLPMVRECLSNEQLNIEASEHDEEIAACDDSVSATVEHSESEDPILKLTAEQKEIYYDLIGYYEYDEKISMNAARLFDNSEEASLWVEDHLDDEEYQQGKNDDFAYIARSVASNDKEKEVPDISEEEEIRSISSLPTTVKILPYDNERFTIERTESSGDDYLTLDELGFLLINLANHKSIQSALSKPRQFSSNCGLKVSAPNLIVTSEENIYKTVLSIYAEDNHLPLPTFEEVLICNQSTTLEQVDLFWQKSLSDPKFKHIFCLVHAQRLSYQVVDKGLGILFDLIRGKKGYRLVIICGSEDESRSHVISRLHLYRRAYVLADDSILKEYLSIHLQQNQHSIRNFKRDDLYASSVTEERSSVCVVLSKRPGMGKSLYVKRLSEKMSKRTSRKSGELLCTIPIHGPDVSSDIVMALLMRYIEKSQCKIFNICISPSVNAVVADIIFSLAALKGLSNSKGEIWRVHPSQLYCFEITAKIDEISATKTLIALLPQMECLEPSKIMSTTAHLSKMKIGMDTTEFQSAKYQRVYQYLKRSDSKDAGEKIDSFHYMHSIEDEPEDCLRTVMRFSGITHPTWRELCNFIEFLNYQLYVAEQSVHLNGTIPGLKAFIVKFLIRMSKDFSTSSLQGEVDAEEGNTDTKHDLIKQLEIVS